MARLRTPLSALMALLVVAGCCCVAPTRCPSQAVQVGPSRVVAADPIEAAADAIVARARALEPRLTNRLAGLATRHGGELAGLAFRLKSPSSIVSRIRRRMERQPGLRPEQAKVRDAVRYTMLFGDSPPRHHVSAVRECLAALERADQRAVSVKNFWQRGDSYAGVNVAMIAPSGMLWELQFHTPASYALKSGTHLDYDRLRAPDTPIEEQRALFDKMTKAYDALVVPAGMLEPKALHERQRMRTFERP